MISAGWRLAAYSCLFFVAIFVSFGGLRFGYSLRSVASLGACGFLIGAIAAPELEPKYFRYPALWQATFGALAGITLVGVMHPTTEAFLAGALIGLLLGLVAPYWIKHVQMP